jgi:hypothetical protein
MATLQTELWFDMQVELGEAQQVGATPRGSQVIAPLTGGDVRWAETQRRRTPRWGRLATDAC